MKAILRLLISCLLLQSILHAAPADLDTLNASIVGTAVNAAVTQPDGKMILVGNFTSVLGQARNHIARLKADGTLDDFNPNAGGVVRCIAVLPNGKILIGGEFLTIGGVARVRIAQLNADGSLDTANFTPPAPNNRVNAIMPQTSGKILIGGLFTNISGTSGLARLNSSGTVDTAFAPGIAGEVRSIVIQTGKILFSGAFTGRIDRVSAEGIQDTTFTGTSSALTVDAIALQADGKILIAGNGDGHVRRLESNGAADAAFAPTLGNRVYGVSVQTDGKILVAGEFTTPKAYLLRLSSTGALDATFEPRPNKFTYGVSIQPDGKILATGDFENLRPNAATVATNRNGLARLQNDVATQTLTASDSSRVVWTRSGAGPELERVTFELSTDGGFNWTSLGNGVRVGTTPNWELTGLTLPSNELLRARGTVRGGLFSGSVGIVEQTSAYNLIQNLTWDPGASANGTEAYTTTYSNGGEYVFRIVTDDTDFDAWRAALKVISGEANLYWSQGEGNIPTTTSYQGSSLLTGSDGFVKQLSTTSGAGQVWYFRVVAPVGSSWSFLAGDIHVEDLGPLADDASSTSTLAAVGPEGARFFRTSLPQDMLAWRLWVKNAANGTVPAQVYTRRNLAAQPSVNPKLHEMAFTGQALLVPDSSPGSTEYVADSGFPYFVGVYAAPGTSLALDNRKQTVNSIAYQSTTTDVVASGYHYHTFLVQVPVQQIAWEATSIRLSGDPNLAVRRNQVPNERLREFASGVAGNPSDSVTVVPNILTEGSYYVTVHSDADFSFRLFNGEPVITDINFASSTTNTDTNRVGWRFFRILDIESQIGEFGWRLDLLNQVPGTQIVTRRNAMPGSTSGLYSLKTDYGFLQEPVHEADIWYVGVYQPAAALGAFTLQSGPINPPTIAMDNGTRTVAVLPPQQWEFVRVDVPAQISGQDVLGWEMRVKDWTGGSPSFVVRRALLPYQLYDRYSSGIGISYPQYQAVFPSGNQHYSGSDQWTRRSNASGQDSGSDRVLSLSMGNPLEPGTYYIGVYNGGAANCAFTFESRAIGKGMSLNVVDATIGSPVTISGLAPREPRFFKYVLPAATPSWQFKLGIGAGTPNGEGMLVLRKDFVPNSQWGSSYYQAPYQIYSGSLTYPCELDIVGEERVAILPASGQTVVPAGTYYAMVVSEGRAVPNSSWIGTGAVDFTLENSTPVLVEDLGTVNFGSVISRAGGLVPGENRYFRLSVPPGTLALSVTLDDQPGTSSAYLKSEGGGLPYGYTYAYGLVGGQSYQHSVTDKGTFTISNPVAGDYFLLVRDQSGTTSSAFSMEVEAEGALPLNFDGGTSSVAVLKPDRWRYYQVTVPTQVGGENVLGWELRVKDWTGGSPQMVVRRGAPPDELQNRTATGSTAFQPQYAATFPSGQQHASSNDQWTSRSNGSGQDNGVDRVLSLATGNPLEPGTYYVGVYNGSTTANCAFTFQSRAIGKGMSLDVVDATVGSTVAITGLAPREPRFFRYVLPVATPSWQFQLGFGAATPNGEGMLVLRKDFVPNSQWAIESYRAPYQIWSGTLTYACGLDIAGAEQVSILPASGQTTVPAGTYYAMVVSEGRAVPNTTWIGTGAVDFTLENSTPVPVEDLGTVNFGSVISRAGGLVPGENRYFRFSVPPDTLALSVTLNDQPGTSSAYLKSESGGLPDGYTYAYGLVGGQSYQHSVTDKGTFTISNPAAGDYFLLVRDQSGTTSSAFSIEVEAEGALPLNFDGGTSSVAVLKPDRWRYYQVTVPAQVGGENVLGWELRVRDWAGGYPAIVVRRGVTPDQIYDRRSDGGTGFQPLAATTFPSGQQHYSASDQWTSRSNSSGQDSGVDRVLSLSMGNPLEPGTYYVGVYNSNTTENCAFTFQTRAIGKGMSLDVQDATVDSPMEISGLAPREPRFFKYVVPVGMPSWQFKLGFGAGTPNGEGLLVLRKNLVPNSQWGSSNGWAPYQIYSGNLTYPCELDIAGEERVTILPASGQTEIPAGTYYAMVVSEGRAVPSASRIGTGAVDFTLENSTPVPVEDLGAVSTGTPISDTSLLVKGGAQFYRYSVDSSVWPLEVRLSGLQGTTPYAYLRTSGGAPVSNGQNYGIVGGESATTQIPGNSVYTLAAPPVGQHAITVQSSSPTTAGAEFELSIVQRTPRPIEFSSQLAGATSNTQSFNLASGQYDFFEVTIPPTVNGQVFLGWLLQVQTTTGSATVSARKDQLPIASGGTFETPTGYPRLYVGQQFWQAQVGGLASLLPGTWYVQLQANGAAVGTVTSEAIFATPLNFDASQNALGGSHTVTRLLGSGEKAFYVVNVPATLNGQDVIAWNLRLNQISGAATVKVSPGTLPISEGVTKYTDSDDDLLLDDLQVPPGTYYVEVNGDSATEFTLTSDAVTSADIARTWEMPVRGGAVVTPGLTAPEFGDSGILANGTPRPNDLGVDIAAGGYDLYTIVVPEGNEGILRAQLDAISGNPDLYIRRGALGSGDGAYDYSLVQSVNTQYGAWVANDGYFQKQLPAGIYYIVVEAASGTNARYRLRLSTGRIQDLAMAGGSALNVAMAREDWRHFRVQVPLDLPSNWHLSYTLTQGNVSMYIRDSVPPGPPGNSQTTIDSWVDEPKNQGNYSDYTTPTSITLSAPQVRPGHTYYIGFRSTTDSTISVTSSVSGAIRTDPSIVSFTNGVANGTLAPGEKRYFRIPAPAGATRWKHTSTHANTVRLYIEQGSFPGETSSDDWWSGGGANSSRNQTMTNTWPWVGGESYYLAIVNTAATNQAFTFTMNGEAPVVGDSDGDGIPNAWELLQFGHADHGADYDGTDHDGSPLLLEYYLGMDPKKPDVPRFDARREANEFVIEFRKRRETEFASHEIEWAAGLQASDWGEAPAVFEKFGDEPETELWRARITLNPIDLHRFFRLRVFSLP